MPALPMTAGAGQTQQPQAKDVGAVADRATAASQRAASPAAQRGRACTEKATIANVCNTAPEVADGSQITWTKAFDCCWDVAVIAVWAAAVRMDAEWYVMVGTYFVLASILGRQQWLAELRIGFFGFWDVALFAIWAVNLDSKLAATAVAAGLFWAASAATKVLDDMVDGDNVVGDAAARFNPSTTVLASALLVGAGSACVIGAAWLSPLAALAMAAQALGCFLAGKIDCWQHAVTMSVITASYVVFSPDMLSSVPWLLLIVGAAVVDEAAHDMADGWKPSTAWGAALRHIAVHRVFADAASLTAAAACGWGSQAIVVCWSGYEGVQPCMPGIAEVLVQLDRYWATKPYSSTKEGKAASVTP